MNKKNHIVILDAHTTNPGDLSWDPLRKFGDLDIYVRSSEDQISSRAAAANILIANKIRFDATLFDRLPKLEYLTLLATGYNNIDINYARSKGIKVCNVPAYSSDSVAQHVFALIFALIIRVQAHHNSVISGQWRDFPDFSYFLQSIPELKNKVMGIYGYGGIGSRVARIANGFGMKVFAYRRSLSGNEPDYINLVDEESLLAQSDFLSLHAPLNDQSRGFIRLENLKKMKSSAFLINTARGGLVNETDLKDALVNDLIAGAALDVISEEPPINGNILFDAPKCIITPHMAWTSVQSRSRLINETVKNIEAFLNGEARNVVN